MRVEVVEGLQTVRFVCDAPADGVEIDLTWHGAFPAIDEPRHIRRSGDDVILDAFRFVQTATVTGTVAIDGEEIDATADGWTGARDRSWGIRPVGQGAPGRQAGRARHVVVLDPPALRRLRAHAGARGGPRRLPHHQRGRAGVARRPHRAAGLGRAEGRVPLGHPLPDPRPHRPARAQRPRARARHRAPRPDAAVGRPGLRPRRRRLEPRPLDGRELDPARRPRPRRPGRRGSGWPGA